jgi:hypothetical protein
MDHFYVQLGVILSIALTLGLLNSTLRYVRENMQRK